MTNDEYDRPIETEDIRKAGAFLSHLGMNYSSIAKTLAQHGVKGLPKPTLKSYKRAEKIIAGLLGTLRKFSDRIAANPPPPSVPPDIQAVEDAKKMAIQEHEAKTKKAKAKKGE